MRQYTKPIDPEEDYIMDAVQFEKDLEEELKTKYTILGFAPSDGYGHWVKDGLESNDDIFTTPRLDATHIVWYNK